MLDPVSLFSEVLNRRMVLRFSEQTSTYNARKTSVPNRISRKKVLSKYIIIKMQRNKGKENLLKARTGKRHLTFREEIPHPQLVLAQTMVIRKKWNKIFKMLKKSEAINLERYIQRNILQKRTVSPCSPCKVTIYILFHKSKVVLWQMPTMKGQHFSKPL